MGKREEQTAAVPAPDGGWGWVCVVGCGMAHFFLAGVARSFGIIYVVLRERFYSSAAVTAWIGALYNVMRFCGGPIAAALVNRFRFRPVVISGGILMFTGFLVSSVAPNIITMFFSYGLMTGFGASLVFAPSYIVVGQYFDKKKGRAMGLSTVGSGFGGLCVPFILKGLYDEYGYFGAMLNMAAIVLNCCVIGAVYRSLEPRKVKKSHRDAQVKYTIDSTGSAVEIDEDYAQENASSHLAVQNEEKTRELNESCLSDKGIEYESKQLLPTAKIENESNHREEKDAESKMNDAVPTASESVVLERESQIRSLENQEQVSPLLQERTSSEVNKDNLNTTEEQEASATNSVDRESVVNTARDTDVEVQALPDVETTPSSKPKKKIFDVALLGNRTFVLYGLMIMSLSITQQTFNIFIVAICKERGIAVSKGVLLAAISGLADMIGRFISGFVFDLKRIRSFRRFLLPALLITGAFCETILPFFTSYIGIAFMSAGMGAFVAAAHAQRATVLTDFLDKSRTANAVGFTIWFQGVGQLFGPAFAGFLRDISGKHDQPFYFGGLITIVTSLLYLLESFITWKCAKRSSPSNKSE